MLFRFLTACHCSSSLHWSWIPTQVEGQRDALQKERDDLREEKSALEKSSDLKISELSEDLLSARQEIRKLEKALEGDRRSNASRESVAHTGLWQQVVHASMHTAGLEAQISAMRLENASSDLLVTDPDEGKSRLKKIYDDAFEQRANQLNVKVPARS